MFESKNRKKLRKNAKIHITVSFFITNTPGFYFGLYNTDEPFLYTFTLKVKEASKKTTLEVIVSKFWRDFYSFINNKDFNQESKIIYKIIEIKVDK